MLLARPDNTNADADWHCCKCGRLAWGKRKRCFLDLSGNVYCDRRWCMFLREHRFDFDAVIDYAMIGLIVAGSVTALWFLLTECP